MSKEKFRVLMNIRSTPYDSGILKCFNVRSILLLIMALLVPASPIVAQQFAAGVKAGGQVTDAVSGDMAVLFDHFSLGPEVEVALPYRLSIEFDALHKHYAYSTLYIGRLHNTVGSQNTHISYWDLPLLLKWRPTEHRLKPFLAGGLSTRYTTGTGLLPPPFPPDPLLNPISTGLPISLNRWTRGLVLGGGMGYAIRYIRFSPEARYTHWTNPAIGAPIILATGPALAWHANTNEVELLLGLTLGTHPGSGNH